MFGNMKHFIELPIACSLFSLSVQISVFTNLIIYRTCYTVLGYNQTECALLGSRYKDNFTKKLEEIVEPDANVINLWLSLPIGFVCAIFALFMGSWSDRNGRKPVLILSIGSQAVSFGIVTVYCVFPRLSPWFLMVSNIPLLVSGGFASMLSAFLSYITDISDEHSRGIRLGIFEIVFGLGGLLGTFSSSYIFDVVGYIGIFVVSTGTMFFALFFIIFALEESLPESQMQSIEPQESFFAQFKAMIKSTFKKRRNYERSLILLCVVITSVFIFAFLSDIGIIFLFLRLKFGWTLERFTIFSSSRDLISIFGTLFGIYVLHERLEVPETVLMIIGLISCFNSSLVQGLASIDFHIYFAGVLRILSGCVNPMVRSLISKLAQPNEIGEIFSVSVMCQSVLQLLGSPIYTEIYNKTLSTVPSLYNYVTAGIYGLLLILTVILMVLINRTPASGDILFNDEETAPLSFSINGDEEPNEMEC